MEETPIFKEPQVNNNQIHAQLRIMISVLPLVRINLSEEKYPLFTESVPH